MAPHAHHRIREALRRFRFVAALSLGLVVAGGPPPAARAQAPAFLVKDINPLTGCIPYGSNPTELTDLDGTLFSVADDGMYGTELWRSDGTETGTRLVKDINPSGGSAIGNLTPLNGMLFFVADDGTSGGEVWRSDGTERGTARLTHFDAGPSATAPTALTAVNGMLFFVEGTALWRIDASNCDIAKLADLCDPMGHGPSALTAMNGELFFIDGGALWKSDGSAAGTMPVADVVSPTISQSVGLAVLNDTLFLFTPTADSGFYGLDLRLWKSDGSAAGTTPLTTIDRGSFFGLTADRFTAMNGMVFWVANSYLGSPGETPQQPVLWRSDGTADGTIAVASLAPDYAWASQLFLLPFDGALYFAEFGRALYRTDGSPNGTVLVKDLVAQSPLVDAGGRLLFEACAATGFDCGLWESDGTAAGTRSLAAVPGTAPTIAGSLAFFSSSYGAVGSELWAVPLASLGRCGDGVVDPGEACDTAGESATCDADCTAPQCGDATVNRAVGEDCDAGSMMQGSCCGSTCRFEPAGTSCRAIGACRADTCDGAGQCLSGPLEPAGTSCDDGDLCNGAEICADDGACRSGTPLLCDDGKSFTFDSCDPSSGCTHTVMRDRVGDCDGDGQVSIGELVMAVKIALNLETAGACLAGDADMNGAITVAEILTAVNNALNAPPPDDGSLDEL